MSTVYDDMEKLGFDVPAFAGVSSSLTIDNYNNTREQSASVSLLYAEETIKETKNTKTGETKGETSTALSIGTTTGIGFIGLDWETRYEYSIKDHLGNTRLTFTDKDGDGYITYAAGEVMQENHYYPFGLNMEGPWVNDAALDNKYQYNGKEFNDDFGLNLNDYGARWYDAGVGRWWSVDMLSEKHFSINPFAYTSNNPIIHIDPDGNDFIVKNEELQGKVIDALATAFNGKNDAFSFDKSGKLSIDKNKLGSLSKDQQFIYDSFNDNIVQNSDYVMVVQEDNEGVTRTEPVQDNKSGKVIGSNVFINTNQSDFDAKMRDTKDGSVKQGDKDYQPTETEKFGTALYHEIGHETESLKGNNDMIRNNRKAVGFENVYRSIMGFTPREGNLHGPKDKNGEYIHRYQGASPPTPNKKRN